jgi:multisubunit Na+/H+ antiporter MnhC subunit
MTNAKKISWGVLYLAAFVPFGLSILYFSEKNLLSALVASSISMFIYTLLVIKDLRFLSSVSFFTMLFVSLLMLGAAGKQTNGIFPNIADEKAFMLAQPLLIFFLLINSVFWAKTKHGFKKLVSLVLISLFVLMLVTFGLVSPVYYQNFVYTRINILILLIFSIFLIIKKRKVLGILGIFLSIGILLLSVGMFAEKTYTLEDKEQKEVIAFVDPLAKEMFGYYNKEDYNNFCKYCGFVLKNMLSRNPIKNNRDILGPYIYFGEPSKVIRKGGRYYVEYPVKFQNVKSVTYLTFVVESISSDPSIYGFAFSDKQEQ